MERTPKAFASRRAGRRIASLCFMKRRSLQIGLVDSFTPDQSSLPRGFTIYPAVCPVRGVLASGG